MDFAAFGKGNESWKFLENSMEEFLWKKTPLFKNGTSANVTLTHVF